MSYKLLAPQIEVPFYMWTKQYNGTCTDIRYT